MLKLAGGGAASTGGRTLGGPAASSLLVTSGNQQETKQISDTDGEEQSLTDTDTVKYFWIDSVISCHNLTSLFLFLCRIKC